MRDDLVVTFVNQFNLRLVAFAVQRARFGDDLDVGRLIACSDEEAGILVVGLGGDVVEGIVERDLDLKS